MAPRQRVRFEYTVVAPVLAAVAIFTVPPIWPAGGVRVELGRSVCAPVRRVFAALCSTRVLASRSRFHWT